MKIIGLVSTTRPHYINRMISSISDCDDVIIVEDVEKRGAAWSRNKLLELAPENCIVRFLDDDDVAFSTRRMAERLILEDVDVLACSYFAGKDRVRVAKDPFSAGINSVAPWSWVAKIESIRKIKWNTSINVMMGTWHWLDFYKNNLKLATAPDIWCYHWIPTPGGITDRYAAAPTFELYQEILKCIEQRQSWNDLLILFDRMNFLVNMPLVDEIQLARRYKSLYEEYPNLQTPSNFHEKMLVRKLYDSNEMGKIFCDKVKLLNWYKSKLNKLPYIEPLYIGREIPDNIELPFMVKSNSSSGWNAICKTEEERSQAKLYASNWKADTFGQDKGEKFYINNEKSLVIEEYKEDVKDLKFFCYDGKIQYYMIILYERDDTLSPKEIVSTILYDENDQEVKNARMYTYNVDRDRSFIEPHVIEKAKQIALSLCVDIDMIRVDFLVDKHQELFLGEMTYYPLGGHIFLTDDTIDKLGSKWNQKVTHKLEYLHYIVSSYVKNRGRSMIARENNVLTSEQCNAIIQTAHKKGFENATVRNNDYSRDFNPAHRGGEVCFLRKEDFPDIFEIILNSVNTLNEKYFNANIDEIDVQIARYFVGQQGFGWHSDDPHYPTENIIWSGRKLTMVIELSDPSLYEGGLLEIDPTNTRKDNIQPHLNVDPVTYTPNDNELVIHIPHYIEGASVDELLELARKTNNEPITGTASLSINKELGSAVLFPSFFNHRVRPVARGVRYSLTVWCKGPKWR